MCTEIHRCRSSLNQDLQAYQVYRALRWAFMKAIFEFWMGLWYLPGQEPGGQTCTKGCWEGQCLSWNVCCPSPNYLEIFFLKKVNYIPNFDFGKQFEYERLGIKFRLCITILKSPIINEPLSIFRVLKEYKDIRWVPDTRMPCNIWKLVYKMCILIVRHSCT